MGKSKSWEWAVGELTRLALVLLVIPGVATAQDPPKRVPTGQLELVARLPGDQPAGVAVSSTGRIFITFPRHDGEVAFTVGEVQSGSLRAYPNAEMNRGSLDRLSETLFSVQNVRVDAENHLWLLDSGFLKVGEPPVPGAPKLVEIDLATSRVIRTIVFPPDALVHTSALKDLRIDLARGPEGTIFITDNALESKAALIVVDLASGRVRRRLEGHPSMLPPADVRLIVGSNFLILAKDGKLQPFASGLNRIELSPDRNTLYYGAFTSRHLFSLDAAALVDPARSDADVARSIKDLGEVGTSSHLETDVQGRLYILDLEHDAILRRAVDGTITTLVADPRLMWPDTSAMAADGFLYVTSSQTDRRPQYNNGQDLRQRPFGLYRTPTGSSQLVLGK